MDSNTFPDTLRILTLNPQDGIPIGIVTAAATLLGVMISILGNYLAGRSLSNRQAFVEIRKTLFLKRLDAYLKIAELLWAGYSVKIRGNEEDSGAYPQAYDSFEGQKDWLNSLVDIIDKSRHLLDQDTYTQFAYLNQKILADRNRIRSECKEDAKLDIYTRKVGREVVSEVQDLSEKVAKAARSFIRQTYKVNINEVRDPFIDQSVS